MAQETVTTYEKGKLYSVDITQLQADPKQPRKSIDPQALEELAASITTHGVLEPVLFRGDEDGDLFVVAGERRVEAAKQAGLATVPAILVDGNHAEIALVENLVRQDLTAVEEAEALDTLMTDRGYNQEQLAGMIGKARTTMNEILSLNRLPQEVRDECRADRAISRATLLEIARKSRPESMLKAYTRYKEKLKKAQEGGKKPGKSAQSAAEVLDWLAKTGKKLGAIDPSLWTPGEKAALAEALGTFQETIKTLLPPENQPA